MEPIRIHELVDRCVRFLKGNNYVEARIKTYQHHWKSGIIKYMDEIGAQMYTPEIGEAFKDTFMHEGPVRKCEKEKIRSVRFLDDMMLLGKIRRSCIVPKVYVFSGEIGEAMEKLTMHLASLRRGKKTISDYRRYLHEFLTYLTDNGITQLTQITESHIIAFLDSRTTCKKGVVTALRMFFHFLEVKKLLPGYFNELLEGYKGRQPEPIPSFYMVKEIHKILGSISRSSAVGKRNYAITILAAYLGLRASDIAKLMLEDIDWDQNLIRVEMQKTKKLIELPLLPDIGNALIDYLRNGRPKTRLHNVFLTAKAPYEGITSSTVSSVVSRIVIKSGVDTTGRKKGPHSLRHSLATSMMNEGSPVTSISEALGHSNTNTTLTYLRINITALRRCALDVPEVPESFYEQKGGALYG